MGNERKRKEERKQKRKDGTPEPGSGRQRRGAGPSTGPIANIERNREPGKDGGRKIGFAKGGGARKRGPN